MLVINGHKFAKNAAEFNSTLFQKDGTAYGFYKIKRRGKATCIDLMNMQGELFAAIIKDPSGYCSIVNARRVDGRGFYQFGASETNEKLLGVPAGYIESQQYAEKIVDLIIEA